MTYDDNADGGFIINGAGMYAISAVTLERTGELYLANTAIMLRPGDVLRPSKNLSFNITRLA